MRAVLLPILLLSLGLGACRTPPDDKPDDTQVETVDADGDGYPEGDDCDDSDAAIHPDAEETCNGIDDDCDGELDEDASDAIDLWADVDGDGYGDMASTTAACEPTEGWVENSEDCDDSDASIHPGADEICNGIDDDCDGELDEGSADLTTWYGDEDGDGYGDPHSSVTACEQPKGHVADATDCDDGDAAVNPAADELCNGVDDDCDGELDGDDAIDAATWYADDDADGYGDMASTTAACQQPSGFVGNDFDCDDGDPAISPDADEICNGIDDDCDGTVDEDGAIDATTWYADDDGDSYGDAADSFTSCAAPGGYVADATDCDDGDATVYPGADEHCDGVDSDCDGVLDEDDAVDASTWYADTDADGFGDPSVSVTSCLAGSGQVADATDCDDSDSAIHPGADEHCDGVDSDCDGVLDEDDAVDASTWYADTDADGFGDPSVSVTSCLAGSGQVADATDCDDSDSAIHPGADEHCDGVDSDCDGVLDEDDAVDASTWYADTDADGFGDPSVSVTSCLAGSGQVADATDCDDSDSAIHPGADEHCDGVDSDCDGVLDEDDAVDASTWYADTDADGFGDPSVSVTSCLAGSGQVADATDCDDGDATVYPGAPELCDGLDNDCDGSADGLASTSIRAGSTSAGESLHYQYSPTTPGDGILHANWDDEPAADSYELAVGSSAGDSDVLGWTDVGAVTAASVDGMSLSGAWEGAVYYVSVRVVAGGAACAGVATSEAVQIAEAETWTGDLASLRPDDAWGGASVDWPEAGVDAVYGEHYFEAVDIDAGTTVMVQGWGAVDSVTAGIDASDAAVTDPADGWLALYANEILVAGTITASGRGYGGGAGGGGGYTTVSYRGYGGEGGLGGDGGPGAGSNTGGGGGGSPGGVGTGSGWTGGSGNIYGAGSGGTGCSGSTGRDGGDGAVGTVGTTGGTASSGSPGAAGEGEFVAGGGAGVSGCDNWSGGGGGGYGAGGGGGTQWNSSGADSAGGGGGGSGGVGAGEDTGTGGAGAGPYAGSGATYSGRDGLSGGIGGYLDTGLNGDSSTDRSLALGGGGGGGGGGYQEAGGGGGGAGGGAIWLYATDTLLIESTAAILANGAGGGGGGRDNGGSATGGAGGAGAGGGICLEAQSLVIDADLPYLSARSGDGGTTAGGSIKLFYDSLSGAAPDPSAAGRVYDAGPGSWVAP